MTTAQKLEAIGAAGVQGTAVVRFTTEMSPWDPETFERTVLVDWQKVSEVWVGCELLLAATARAPSACGRWPAIHGFNAEKIDPVRYRQREFVVSSTRIRRLVQRRAPMKRARCSDGSILSAAPCARCPARADDREPRRICRPTTNCCRPHGLRHHLDDRRHRPSRRLPTSRCQADGGPTRRVSVEPARRRSGLYGASMRVGFGSGCETSAPSGIARCAEGADRCRPRPLRACCSSVFHCRICVVSPREFVFCALELSGSGGARRC